VGGIGIGSLRLRPHGMDLQRHDGQAVHHAAGGLAVQACARRRGGHGGVGTGGSTVHQAQRHQQDLVHPLGGVVARLVESVDGPLVGRDLSIGHPGAPRQIFLAPQQGVEAVVGADPAPQAVGER
jgi:hypothetical protein